MRDTETTRRRLLLSGGAAASALLAGCAGGSGPSGSNDSNGSDGNETTDAGSNATGGDAESGYSVTMKPVGTVEFDAVPERVAHYFPGYADMAVALGHGASITSVGVPSRYHTGYYEQLDGVSVDKSGMTALVGDGGIDKELFYELDSDLHLIDPRWLVNNSFFALEESDVEELSSSVAPFLGNTIFRRTDEWHDYPYYTMYEAFEKVAEVYQERERYEAFAEFHDAFIDDVQSNLPPESERPAALLCFGSGDQPEQFSPYRLSDEGTNKKQFHDLGIQDALAETDIEGLSTSERGQIDYETMLEVDPESILVRGHEGKTREEFQNTVVAFMEEHPVASDLTAVKEGRVFRGGPIYEGPIQNLFLTERFAKLYFPDAVGDGDLFDRAELAGIVTGN
ncbi:ABC transporter substrate-binding protein [Halomarina litorea]|uniref:ABC transporter substrate-binding protein n=1 Tax=Halomarina litorea TaxID=2961595 RepID=UPI0020C47E79|nr:ABC transporter substrate-binding protein [Halomarina sp. BCD28]